MIDRLNMEHYSGEVDSYCKDYLRWFTFDGNDYFMIDNPCADLALHLWNCDKVDLCQSSITDCQETIGKLTAHGIVGRSE